MTSGPLILVGGSEFTAGNEPIDRLIAERVTGPAYLVATAAVRQDPDRAVTNARRWFAKLGVEVDELRIRGRRDANDSSVARLARDAGGFYLCGGDPGLVVRTLSGTGAWTAIVTAWRGGAVLAGSSAGAMALGEWTLLRARMPGDATRRFAPALGRVPRAAVVPHFDEFGERWLPSAMAARPEGAVLLGIDVRTAAAYMDGRWRVLGAGGVTLIKTGSRRRFAAGSTITGLPHPLGR